MIFDKIGNMFWINCMTNAGWLFTFQFNNTPAFIVSSIIIIAMWITTYEMMEASIENKVNWVEFITMRLGFSLYCGWVTTATILNFIFISEGLRKDMAGFDEGEYQKYSEEEDSTKSIIILYFALIVYVTITTLSRNPVYGMVFLWALKAIKAK
jgi:polyferredoxin